MTEYRIRYRLNRWRNKTATTADTYPTLEEAEAAARILGPTCSAVWICHPTGSETRFHHTPHTNT